MRSLTEIVPSPDGHRVPMLLSVSLPADLDGPFLVSSSKSLLWVSDKFPSGVVRIAVRREPLPVLWGESINFVYQMSKSMEWGSTAEATRAGALRVISHLADYGLSDVEVLAGPGFDTTVLPSSVPVFEEGWVTPGWAVVVPQDRSYLGTGFDFGDGQAGMVIHNASRAMGVLAPAANP